MKVKSNRRGFTLIELVVVIAILAILAAIAIPMVVNIINSAINSSGETQAQTLTQECANTYTGIKSGIINNTLSKNADGSDVTFAATQGAGIVTRTSAADNATLADVKKYSGLNVNLGDYYYCDTTTDGNGIAIGTIVFSETGEEPIIDGCTFQKLDDSVGLGNLFRA